MRRALSLAVRGAGRVCPNPMVGAVIVKDDAVIGEGWHRKYGDLHAERDALRSCRERGNDPRGAEMFVTLEPCCHYGKQPPCTDALIEAGIRRVYVGTGDPNPKVAGKGIRILRDHGIEVVEHVLEPECRAVNDIFFHFITTGLPLIFLKYAMTLDGKTACVTGDSRWVTGEEARRRVHEDRNRLAAILVGVNTVLSDDPFLTCRSEGGRNPLRVICDSHLRTPLSSQIVRTAAEVPTVLATLVTDPGRQAPYRKAGCRILVTSEADGHVDLKDLMKQLGAGHVEGAGAVDSVLIEGGSTIAWSALRSGIVDRVQAYIAPKLFGGADAKTPVGGTGFPHPEDACVLSDLTCTRLGADFLIEGKLAGKQS